MICQLRYLIGVIGCCIMSWLKFRTNCQDHKLCHLRSRIAFTKSKFNYETFRQPFLSDTERNEGCRLGFDSWADTFCAGRHAHVEEFVQGKSITASGFAPSLGSISDLPIAHVLYAYDMPDGTVMIIECNNAIYMGENMEDGLANPIQAEENGVRIDIRPRAFYPDDKSAQTIQFPNDVTLDIQYDGVLPFSHGER